MAFSSVFLNTCTLTDMSKWSHCLEVEFTAIFQVWNARWGFYVGCKHSPVWKQLPENSSALQVYELGDDTFYKIQTKFCLSNIEDLWKRESSNVISQLSSKDSVVLLG